MLISGITYGLNSLENETKRPVESALGTASSSAYYKDENSDRTHTLEFKRMLEDAQREEMLHEKKHRDMLKSDDYKMLLQQLSGKQFVGNRIDKFR